MKPEEGISGDRPLNNPDDDELGYASFASHLGKRILTTAAPEGFVIAINGPWGSGKTSLLNMVRFFLRERESDERPILIQFDPWWFASREDLVRRFFETLQSAFEGPGAVHRIRELFNRLGGMVSRLPVGTAADVGRAVEWFTTAPELTVPGVKEMIAEQLCGLGKLVVVTIDDIDRLTFDEIRQVFRLVKAVGDFPNVVYILAFDPRIVAKALVEPGSPAEKTQFIEKIVQVPIDLPIIDRSLLHRMFFRKLDALDESVGGHDLEMFDEQYWGNVFLDGIGPLLKTPRDVARLMNALQFTYPAVHKEVNLADFVAIEALRVFQPRAYDLVRSNPNMFLHHSELLWGGGHKKVDLGELLTSAGVKEDARETTGALLKRMFPRLEANYGNDFDSNWRRQGRICSPERFPIYFAFSLPKGEFSTDEIKSLLNAAKDSKEFSESFLRLSSDILADGTSRARGMLIRIQDYTAADLELAHIPNVVTSLLEIGDRLCREEDRPFDIFAISNDLLIARVLRQILVRLEEPDRFRIFSGAAREGAAVGIITQEVAIFGQEYGKHGAREPVQESNRTFTAEHLQELERIALDRVRAAAADGTLLNLSGQLPLLNEWREMAGVEEVSSAIKILISTDQGLVKLLAGSLNRGTTHGLTDRVGSTFYQLDPEWFRPFFDPSTIIDRCRTLLEGGSALSEKEKLALKEFVREYEIRQAGGNPQDPLTKILPTKK
ncbi:MAG: P-loop NTPase fold protein [Candidatus Binatus sp.]|uniref:KAP family NTPase n=1 Tax=Candidatus Binatus sp. TaxID=2811406 RepID=UPI003BB1A992